MPATRLTPRSEKRRTGAESTRGAGPLPRGLHAYGLALVASREYDAAIEAFDRGAAATAPDDAVVHSDLSAALLERHRLSGQRRRCRARTR
jgi:Flp pilus assembly protein TadD